MIEKADLSRYAGQFVWLELNFDKAVNRPFFTKYGAISTPTFYVIDPVSGHVTASRMGAMSLAEFTQFLDRGAAGVTAKRKLPPTLHSPAAMLCLLTNLKKLPTLIGMLSILLRRIGLDASLRKRH